MTAWLLSLPLGRKIELIRRGGTNAFQIYEAQDDSLLRLTVASSARYLYFPNGTRLTFRSAGQCLEIRDRNGNLITATYDPNFGYLTKITDTLGREVNFEYNPYFDLADIKQTRRDENNIPVTVTLAHFGYMDVTLNTNFSAGSDPANGDFDRAYNYDYLGRVISALTGPEARDLVNQTNSGQPTGPYKHSYSWDQWSKQTAKTGRYWTQPINLGFLYIIALPEVYLSMQRSVERKERAECFST